MIYLVKDDNGTQVECLVTRDNTGLPVDLTGATALLKFRRVGTSTILFTLTNISDDQVDLEAGQAVFQFSAANLDLTGGLYEAEVQVTFANTNIETVYEVIDFQVRADF